MPRDGPSFSLPEYWDKRFQNDSKAFDWLLPESCFDGELESFSIDGDNSIKNVLHIGPGTSMLSFHLRRILGGEYQIHNVDFSHEAVEWGKSKEKEICSANETNLQSPSMRWTQVSLLSLSSILAASAPSSVSLVVDKSTSDAIACGLDVRIRDPQSTSDEPTTTKIQPLHILALHLAIVAVPKARWLTLSYSKERYPFLPTLFAPFPDPLPDGFPDPNRYWKLRHQKEIQTEQDVPEKFQKAFNFVHRPVTSHYLYVLERTGLKLSVAEVEKLSAQAEER